MAGLIEEIQAQALDANVKVGDLLRKVKLAAAKLRLNDAVDWADAELTGYKGIEDIPDYRKIVGRVMVHNPYQGVYPLGGNAKVLSALSQAALREPISALEELIRKEGEGLMVPLSRDVVNKIAKMNGGVSCDINNHITTGSVVAIIDHVRNLVLNWSISLEQQGILGEGISFSMEEKKKAEQVASTVTINNYGHLHQGDVNGHQNRTVVGSTDSSVNSLEINDTFDQLIQAVDSSIGNENDREAILDLVRAMQAAQGTPEYKPLFQRWVGYVAEYATILGPFVPALSSLAG